MFETLARTGSAGTIVRWFRSTGLYFPRRLRHGVRKGELIWGGLGHGRVLQVLHHPRYAGAFVFGCTRTRLTLDGRVGSQLLPRDQWQVILTENHPGYISWEREHADAGDMRETPVEWGASFTHPFPPEEFCHARQTPARLVQR